MKKRLLASIISLLALSLPRMVMGQNLFVANAANGTITQITLAGVPSTFASGLNFPLSLAFDSQGDLFEADEGSGNIYEFTPSGVRSTFATGLGSPEGLAFNRPLKNSFLTEKYANSSMNLRVNFQIHGFFSILLTAAVTCSWEPAPTFLNTRPLG